MLVECILVRGYLRVDTKVPLGSECGLHDVAEEYQWRDLRLPFRESASSFGNRGGG